MAFLDDSLEDTVVGEGQNLNSTGIAPQIES